MEGAYYKSEAGIVSVNLKNQEVSGIFFVEEIEKIPLPVSPLIKSVIKQIDEYLYGKRRDFTFPISPKGTDFQVKIWKLLSRIPYGTSLAYVKVAQAFGESKMVRAIASAIAKNPLLIFIPCHRVVGSDESLVGYSGGITTKRQLPERDGFPKQLSLL